MKLSKGGPNEQGELLLILCGELKLWMSADNWSLMKKICKIGKQENVEQKKKVSYFIYCVVNWNCDYRRTIDFISFLMKNSSLSFYRWFAIAWGAHLEYGSIDFIAVVMTLVIASSVVKSWWAVESMCSYHDEKLSFTWEKLFLFTEIRIFTEISEFFVKLASMRSHEVEV